MKWIRKYWYFISLGIIIIIIIGVAVWIQFTKDTNATAKWFFTFVDDWASTLMAAATVGLAIATFFVILSSRRQVELMVEQRRKSIEPSLQINEMSIDWNWTDLERLIPPLQVKDATKKIIPLHPELRLELSNIGSGAAIGITISTDVVIDFSNKDTQEHTLRNLHFSLLGHERDQYIQPTFEKPRTFRLALVCVDSPSPEQKAGSASLTISLNDIDGNHFAMSMSRSLPRHIYETSVKNFTIIPGDPDFVWA